MKKIGLFLTLLALLPFTRAFAQQGEIIFVDFDPDWIGGQSWYDTLWIDFDEDGGRDLLFYWELASSSSDTYFHTTNNSWTIHAMADSDTIPISEIENYWLTRIGFERPTYNNPAPTLKYAIRHRVGNDYYYGWYKVLSIGNTSFDMYAFCTIPNYPLYWGQTDMVGVEENEANHAKLHPNPTTGFVHIEGVECAEVQVYDAFGKQLKTIQNNNEVSLVGLPQGVYLLRVTLKDGKVFSDKVVKE